MAKDRAAAVDEETAATMTLPPENGAKRRKGEWFFGTSGKVSFLGSLILVLILCFADVVIPGKNLVPNYVKYVLVIGLIYAIASMGINFHSGYVGDTSLGHAAFFGAGAYMTAYLTVYQEWNFWLTIPVAMLVAGLCSLPVAWAGQRCKGSFMVVITYGFSEILRYLAVNSRELGGTSGISGIPTPRIADIKITKLPFFSSNKDAFLLIMYVLVVVVAFFTWRMIHSRIGYGLAAVREDDIAAKAMGINVKRYKLMAIFISAVICGLAGCFYAAFSNYVSPDLLGATLSINIFTMLVVGGRRSIKGAILGAFIVNILPELLRNVQSLIGLPFDPWYILYGLLLVIMMRYKPEGLFGEKES